MAVARATPPKRSELSVDPPSADASESVIAMARLDQRLMAKVVCVTLEQPYLDDAAKTVILTWGYGDATPATRGGHEDFVLPNTSLLAEQDPNFIQPRWDAGKPIHYHLRWTEGPLGHCACGQDPETIVGTTSYMPAPVAKSYWGDWDVAAYALRQRPGMVLDQVYTLAYHRDRVADQWGGYTWDFPAGSPGVRRSELRRFEAPNVPHVSIQRVDSMSRLMPNTKVRPWEIFQWERQLHNGPRAYHAGNAPQAASDVISVTESQFEAMIEKAVNAKLAAMAMNKRSAQT